jgi:uncharacterized protein Yka (UPF0111/DUF47 family)
MSKEILSQGSASEENIDEMSETKSLTPSMKQYYDAYLDAAESYDKLVDKLNNERSSN